MNDFDWKGKYQALCKDHTLPASKPLIAISGNFGDKGCELAAGYYQSVRAAGGVPVVIPPDTEAGGLPQLLDRVDGLLLSGGGDINPLCCDEQPVLGLHSITPERDVQELLLTRLAMDRQIPILGICRGIQVIAVACGGSVIQDLGSEESLRGKLIKHDQDLDRRYASHTVQLEADSILAKIYDKESLQVNSLHHQAVGQTGDRLRVTARSSDGVVEAVESTEHKSILGVQWHPETYILRGDTSMLSVFTWLVGEAREFAEARRIHSRILTLDTHNDTPMKFDLGLSFAERNSEILVDAHKMREGHLDATIMAAYLEQQGRSDDELLAATAKANHLLEGIRDRIAGTEGCAIANTPADLWRLKREGKLGIMRAIENGYAIGKDISNVERFRREHGVVYITLCHNGDNDLCDSAVRSHREHRGLSPLGADVIAEMNRVGIMVDLSHASEESFYGAMEASKTPIVCSHASTKALCNHPRNLSDDQLRALKRTGGVMQVTVYPGFLRLDGQATIEDAVAHLLHAVEVAGVESVGIGTDFDGDGGVPGIGDSSEVINFTRRLLRHHFSESDIQLIWGGNFLRVMQQVQDAGQIKL